LAKKPRSWLFSLLALSWAQGLTPTTEAGYILPTRDTLYLLVVFAEVDYSACGEDPYEKQYGRFWPVDSAGWTQVPADAPDLIDAVLTPGENPRGIITRTYVEASFGQFVLLGDYLPVVVRVPCQAVPAQSYSLYGEVELVARYWPAGVSTARGVPWEAFDRYALLPARYGLPKSRASPDTPLEKRRLDALFIIWRNLAYRLGARPPFPCNYGFGLWTCDYQRPFGPFGGGVELASSYTTCGTAMGAAVGFLVEFFHGLYGGNHWHTAGGAGLHTFPIRPAARGLSVQGGDPVYAIGYDRWLMGWKHPQKKYLLSALGEHGEEVPTDLVMPQQPLRQRFILRDFMTTGDVVRIRLPYLERGGPAVKAQYLWIENRQFVASTETWAAYSPTRCPDNPFPDCPKGVPGLYAYLQVGKDLKEGPDIYSASPSHPNGLGSWIFWLPADGRYDFYFDTLRRQPGNPAQNCNWGHPNIPIDRSKSLPNPFLGLHDFYLAYDENGDGRLYSGDRSLLGLSLVENDSVIHTAPGFGDAWDGWSRRTGFWRLSLETNPAPVPVYTLRSEEGYQRPTAQPPQPYDNRIIWLSGLSITLLDERPDGTVLIEVAWDDFTVRKDVRWCGDIRLSRNPFDSLAPSLILRKATLLLDRSESPVYAVARSYDSLTKRFWFSDTTELRLLPGAILELQRGKILLRRGSRLYLENGSILRGKGKIIAEPGSQVRVAPGACLAVPVRQRRKPLPSP
jgi:signal peptidase I